MNKCVLSVIAIAIALSGCSTTPTGWQTTNKQLIQVKNQVYLPNQVKEFEFIEIFKPKDEFQGEEVLYRNNQNEEISAVIFKHKSVSFSRYCQVSHTVLSKLTAFDELNKDVQFNWNNINGKNVLSCSVTGITKKDETGFRDLVQLKIFNLKGLFLKSKIQLKHKPGVMHRASKLSKDLNQYLNLTLDNQAVKLGKALN